MDCVCEWSNCVFVSKPLSACNTLLPKEGFDWGGGTGACALGKVLGYRALNDCEKFWGGWDWGLQDKLRWFLQPELYIRKRIVNWSREILGCLNLFLNKFWALCSHGTIINKMSWTGTERTHFLLCGRCEDWDLTSSYGKDLVQFLDQKVHLTVDVYWLFRLVNTTFLLNGRGGGPVRSRNRSMMHGIVTQSIKMFLCFIFVFSHEFFTAWWVYHLAVWFG